MKQKIHNAKLLIKDNKVKEESDNIWGVDGEFVRINKKPGRTILSCSCKNCSRFCNENTLCKRKIATLLYISNEIFYKRIDKLIELYENCIKINMKPENEVIIQELKDLKYFR